MFLLHYNLFFTIKFNPAVKSIIDNIQENLYETNQEIFHKTRTIDCDNISTISISQLHYEIENKILFDHFPMNLKKAKPYAIIGASELGKQL